MFRCQQPKCGASINNGDSLYNCGNGIWKCLKHSKKTADPVAELIATNNKKVKAKTS